MWLLFFLVWLSFPQISQSAERPKLPEPGWDLELTGGKTPREFFKARMDQPACREKLEDLRIGYLATKETLAKKISDGQPGPDIEKQERVMNSARDAWVKTASECGPCAARDTKKDVIAGVAKKEVWYTSHGSCQLSEASADKLTGYFDRWRDSLLHVKQYAHKNGGFFYILDLVAYNPQDGKPLAIDALESSPVQAVLSVRGPVIVFPTGFSYYAEQKFQTQSKDGVAEFYMNGTSVTPPSGYQEPVIEDVLASGRKVKVAQTKVGNVLSQWYVTADGYVRYFTAGDFRAELKFVEEQAKTIMLDTVLNMAERAETNPR